jgi:hypothetical protein
MSNSFTAREKRALAAMYRSVEYSGAAHDCPPPHYLSRQGQRPVQQGQSPAYQQAYDLNQCQPMDAFYMTPKGYGCCAPARINKRRPAAAQLDEIDHVQRHAAAAAATNAHAPLQPTHKMRRVTFAEMPNAHVPPPRGQVQNNRVLTPVRRVQKRGHMDIVSTEDTQGVDNSIATKRQRARRTPLASLEAVQAAQAAQLAQDELESYMQQLRIQAPLDLPHPTAYFSHNPSSHMQQ